MATRRLLLAFLLAIGAVLAVVLSAHWRAATVPPTSQGPTSQPAAGEGSPGLEGELPSPSRRATPSPRVLAADTREPLPDARVRWVAGEATASGPSYAEPSLLAVDPAGRVDPSALDATGPAEAHLLISCPGFQARSWTRRGTDAWPPELALARGRPFAARVVDAGGKPIPGSTLEHSTDTHPRGPRPGAPARSQPNADVGAQAVDLPWQDVWVAADDGRVELASFPGRNRLQASFGEMRSAPWSGPPHGDVDLVLLSTFRAQGRVSPPAGQALPEGLVVTILSRQSDDHERLARSQVGRNGEWSSGPIPLVPADGFVFLLEGASFAQDRREVRAPRAGSVVTVDFAPSEGIELVVRVVGEGQIALDGAFVSAHWSDDGVWQKLERTSGADGIARMPGCRPGRIWIRARAVGHAPVLLEPVECFAPPPQPIEVSLARAGRIEGFFREGDRAVSDFAVTFWQGSPNAKGRIEVEASDDGRFAIDEAPAGQVDLVAVSDAGARSAVTSVEVETGETARVELSAQPATTGRGRVVDAARGQPIEGARVQLVASSDLYKVARCGPAVATDGDGRFALDHIVPGRNAIEVEAPGFASRSLGVVNDRGEPVDYGTIRLVAQRALRVRLLPDGELDGSRLEAQLRTRTRVFERRFSASGELAFEGLDPEPLQLRITDTDGAATFLYFDLPTDENLLLEVPWATTRRLVEVVAASGTSLPADSWLLVSHNVREGLQAPEYYPVPADGRVRVRRQPADQLVLQLEASDTSILAVERYDAAALAEDPLRLVVGRSERAVRVVDRDGAPIDGATVTVMLPEDPSRWRITPSTNADGICRLGDFGSDEVLLGAYHPEHGVLPCRTVELEGEGATEVELAPRATLRARVVERGQALADVEVIPTDGCETVFGLDPRSSGPDGDVAWQQVGAGRYLLRVRQPGIWPHDASVDLREDSGPFVLDVRRLGDLSVRVRTKLGSAVEGCAVELRSEETGTSASQWLEQGRVGASSRPMRTDAKGELTVSGLPNGEYSCQVTLPAGETLERELVVAPGASTTFEIEVP